MQGASQTLSQAQTAYQNTVNQIYMQAEMNHQPPDQGALNAAFATLEAANHAYSNTAAGAAASLTQTLGNDYVTYVQSEETAYVTEQDALNSALGTYDLAQLAAQKTEDDSDADALATCTTNTALINAAYNNDVGTHQEARDLQLAGFQATHDDAYATAQAGYNNAVSVAWQTQTEAYASAGQTRDNADAAAIASMDNQLADIQQQLSDELSGYGETQVESDAAAQAAYSVAMGKAFDTDSTSYTNALVQADDQEVTNDVSLGQQIVGAITAALTGIYGNDPTVQAEIAAWTQYDNAVFGAYQTLEDGCINAAAAEQANDQSARLTQVNNDSAAEIALADLLAPLAQGSDLANDAAIDTQNHQDDAAIVPFVTAETGANVTEIQQETTADVTDQQANTAAALLDAFGHIADALTYVQTVLPAMLQASVNETNQAATVTGILAQDADAQEHNDTAAAITEANLLIPAAESAAHKDAVAHQTYFNALAPIAAAAALATANQFAAFVAAEPDSNFSSPQQASPVPVQKVQGPQVPDRMTPANQAASGALAEATQVYGQLIGEIARGVVLDIQLYNLRNQQALQAQQQAAAQAQEQMQAAQQKAAAQQQQVQGKAGQPVPAIQLVNGKGVVKQANLVPFFIQTLIDEFNTQAPNLNPATAALYWNLIRVLHDAGIRSPRAAWDFVSQVQGNTTKKAYMAALVALKVAP
jgi:hypothetical protein